MKFILRILVTAFVAYILSKVLTGVTIASLETAVLFSFVLAVLNAIVKPLLVFFTLPLTIVSLGLFLFIINAIIIMLADSLVSGIKIESWLTAIIFSLLLSVGSSIAYSVLDKSLFQQKEQE